MKLSHYLLLLCTGLALFACKTQKKPRPAHLRLLSTIQYTSVKVTIRGKNEQHNVQQTLSLSYGQPTEYQQLSPGYYAITLSVEGKPLLKGTYALGKNGYYTLLAMGLLPKKWDVNPQSTMYHLKYIFAGEELVSTNKYLPQWFMMRDNYDGSKKSAYIRLVNANPVTAALTIKKGKKSLKSGLAYPIESGMIKLKPGDHHLRILYGSVLMGKKTLTAKAGYIYTAVITNKENSNGELTTRILENPSRTLLHSQ